MAACSEVLCKGARFSSDKYFDIVNSAVAHIRNRKINDAVTSEERESADRTKILKTVYFNMISGKIYNSKSSELYGLQS